MLAIACVMEGQSREEASEACGMDRQTLRDWVHRFNADGLAGLADLARDGVVRWRCVGLQERTKREWGVSLHERTRGKLLRKLAVRRVSARPQRPKGDPEAQALFRAGLRAL